MIDAAKTERGYTLNLAVEIACFGDLTTCAVLMGPVVDDDLGPWVLIDADTRSVIATGMDKTSVVDAVAYGIRRAQREAGIKRRNG